MKIAFVILTYMVGFEYMMSLVAQVAPTHDIMPYLDKIGTVGLALLVAYMMYKEMQRREKEYSEKEKYLLKELLNRLDEKSYQVNDLIKNISRGKVDANSVVDAITKNRKLKSSDFEGDND